MTLTSIWCLWLRHSKQVCGEMSVDLLANRNHLNETFGIFAINVINGILEADVPSYVNPVARIEIVRENVAFVLDNNTHNTFVHNF